jgi:hypothetical protein
MTLAERHGLGYPVPLDPRCFVHLCAVTDSREALVARPCVLLAIHRTGHLRYLVAVLKELQHRGVGLGYRLGQGEGLAGKVLEAPGLIECSGVVDARGILRGGSAGWFVLPAWGLYVVAGDLLQLTDLHEQGIVSGPVRVADSEKFPPHPAVCRGGCECPYHYSTSCLARTSPIANRSAMPWRTSSMTR